MPDPEPVHDVPDVTPIFAMNDERVRVANTLLDVADRLRMRSRGILQADFARMAVRALRSEPLDE